VCNTRDCSECNCAGRIQYILELEGYKAADFLDKEEVPLSILEKIGSIPRNLDVLETEPDNSGHVQLIPLAHISRRTLSGTQILDDTEEK